MYSGFKVVKLDRAEAGFVGQAHVGGNLSGHHRGDDVEDVVFVHAVFAFDGFVGHVKFDDFAAVFSPHPFDYAGAGRLGEDAFGVELFDAVGFGEDFAFV